LGRRRNGSVGVQLYRLSYAHIYICMKAGERYNCTGNVMGVSSSITVDSFLSFFSYTEGGIVGGSDVDVGDDGIFLSVGWHTKLVVAQRIERRRIKKRDRKKERKNPSLCDVGEPEL
jgi:hypothetical protein